MEAGIAPDAPLDEEMGPDVLGYPRDPVDHCPSQQDIMDIYADGQDTDSPPR